MAQETQARTRTVQASAARQQWSALLGEVFRERSRVIVEKSGIPVAALISLHDLERLRRLDAQAEQDLRTLAEFRAAFVDVPDEELEREVERAVAEARAEGRRERRTHRSA